MSPPRQRLPIMHTEAPMYVGKFSDLIFYVFKAL